MKKTIHLCAILYCTCFLLNSQTTFSTKKIINATTGANPYVIDSGTLDGDSTIDIAIGTDSGNTIEWYTNDGNGNFIKQTNLSNSLSWIEGIEIADIDSQNGNDIIATGYNSDNLVWFQNNGDGTFAPEVELFSSLDGAGTVIAANLDEDINNIVNDYLDLIVVVSGPDGDTDSVIWYPGNGNGTFGNAQFIVPQAANTSPSDIDVADFDGDGDLDVVVSFLGTSYGGNGNIEVYDNRLIPDGSVSFVKYTNSVDTGNVYLFDVSFADVNDDNVLDIIKSDLFASPNPRVAWYKNDLGTIATTFTETTISTSIVRTAVVMVKDLNGDNFTDIVITNGTTGSNNDIVWFESTGAGTFFPEATISISGDQKQTYGITIADFNGDAKPDIASIDFQGNQLMWFENDPPPLSVIDNFFNKISIYPNPTKNQLNFKGFSDSFDVSVYDILGKNVLNKNLDVNSSLDVSKLQNGIYIIKFKDYNSTFKFVKQ